MDLNVDMNSLFISAKKRRLSGILRCVAVQPASGSPSLQAQDASMGPAVDNTELPSTSSGLPESAPLYGSPPEEEEMPKEADNTLSVRRSSRRRSLLNSEPAPASAPCTSSVLTCVRLIDDDRDLKALKKIYLDKRVKKVTPSLETIFEMPVDEKLMSSRKFKRKISFQELQKNKVRKRPLKAKQTLANYIKMKRKNRVSMDTLMQKLNDLEGD